MKYKLEFHPNPDCLSIHLTKRLTKDVCHRFESPYDKIDLYNEEGTALISRKDPPTFVTRIFEVNGITTVHIGQFEISLSKGSVFDWNNMVERIIAILNVELFPNEEPEQVGAAKKPSKALLRALRKQGCDV